MLTSTWKRIGPGALFLAGTLAAQQPASAPRFDVVSIREVPRDAPPVLRSQDFTAVLPGGKFIDSRTNLLFLIAFAYNVKHPSMQLIGLPDWAMSQSFSMAAKPAPDFPTLSAAENYEQVRLMMRETLAERFHLRLHTETRQEQIFSLEVARGGIKVKEVEAPVPPAREGNVGAAMGNSGGRMIGKKSTMAGIATAVTIFLKRPVVDRTGLKGYYDFDLKWSAPEATDGQQPSPGLGSEGLGLLISTLQNQLGLRLTKTNGPVDYWLVDQVERPTGN